MRPGYGNFRDIQSRAASMTSLEVAQSNVREARMRLDLVRSFVRGSRLTVGPETEPLVLQLLATLEQHVRLHEDYWKCLLKEEDRLSTLSLAAAPVALDPS